jgi:hypothetical protein
MNLAGGYAGKAEFAFLGNQYLASPLANIRLMLVKFIVIIF